MYYYKQVGELGELIALESREVPIKNLPSGMVEITKAEYDEEMEKILNPGSDDPTPADDYADAVAALELLGYTGG